MTKVSIPKTRTSSSVLRYGTSLCERDSAIIPWGKRRMFRSLFLAATALRLENLALRQQLAILKHQSRRPTTITKAQTMKESIKERRCAIMDMAKTSCKSSYRPSDLLHRSEREPVEEARPRKAHPAGKPRHLH